jgi:methionyl-tRNA formyltransferase
MTLVLLTGDGPEHRYVANRLASELPIDAIIVDERHRTPSLRRAFRKGVRNGIGRVSLHAFRKVVRDEAAYAAALQRVLGPRHTEAFGATRVARVDGINGQAALDIVQSLEPDAILVYGTTIVRNPMLALARDLALNLHTGISPRYRGTDCAFWPVVNGEPEWIGATTHECTTDVDGGRIFGVARAEWHEGDGVHELFARAVAVGAELYVDTVRTYLHAGRIDGDEQDLATGSEYRGSMRTLTAELRARLALRRGLLQRSRNSANLRGKQGDSSPSAGAV